MLAAPIPANDAERLAALHRLLILDTPPQQRFDKVVQFAAAEFDMPIATISLVDQNRQWFMARVGMPVCETARDISFCGHAIAGSDVLLIPDALADARFADNPLVGGPPHVRFYAGAPLTLPCGNTVGTLCVMDSRPRQFGPVDLAILRTLRDLLVQELGRPAGAGHV